MKHFEHSKELYTNAKYEESSDNLWSIRLPILNVVPFLFFHHLRPVLSASSISTTDVPFSPLPLREACLTDKRLLESSGDAVSLYQEAEKPTGESFFFFLTFSPRL